MVEKHSAEWHLWMFRLYSIWSKVMNEREIKLKQKMDEMVTL